MTLDRPALLRAYDDQLRTDAETPSALAVARLGPLRLVTFAGGRGFVTYRDLGGAGAAVIRSWVGDAVEHFASMPDITQVEWKTRGHDEAPGLHPALLAHGFRPDDEESVMIGPAAALVADVPLPPEVTLRRITEPDDVHAMEAMAGQVFGDALSHSHANAEALLRRLTSDDGMQLWVAEAEGWIVSCGRLEPVPGTDVAGIWGGATRPEWRGRGIYRALTSARARSALALGKTLMHSDSTEYSRPILERAGLVRVTTTTPYEWRRRGG
ncbi:MAG: GNAT family N-acetyltransferase [Dermatophilaceae bacterium]